MEKLVVVGNGMAGIGCLEQILRYAPKFEVTVFGDETHVNYNRILLSSVLAGERDSADIVALGFPAFCTGPAAPANLVAHHASDMQQPIACGGVAVYPDDIMFGDGEAVVVIPRHYADEIADEAVAMEAQEEFLKQEIESGKPTFGVYPPNAETLERYRAWQRNRQMTL